jgi:hypothetical protein
VPAANLLRYFYLAYFSQPNAERLIYRTLRRAGVNSIVELGVGTGRRTRRILEVARRYQTAADLRYAGIDLFESRPPDSRGLSLKVAHRLLRDSGAKVQLVPGDPWSALSRTANSLANTSLLVISADQHSAALEKAWFYVPRMLHERSLVFLEETAGDGKCAFRRLSLAEVDSLAAKSGVRPARRAA